MNEILAENIIESNVTERKIKFDNLIDYIKVMCNGDIEILKWFRSANNIIGFSAAISKLDSLPSDVSEFKLMLERFEDIMTNAFDTSKLKVGQARRKLVFELTMNHVKYEAMDRNQMTDELSMVL